MRKFLDRVYDGGLVLAGLFLIGIFLVMISESVLRKLGGYVPGAGDLIGWFCAAAGFLALPATFKRGDMVRVGLLIDKLPAAARKPMLLACLATAVVFVSYMLWATCGYLLSGWRSDELTQGMIEIAVWVPQSSFAVGALLLLVAVVDELVVVARAPAERLFAEKPPAVDDASSSH